MPINVTMIKLIEKAIIYLPHSFSERKKTSWSDFNLGF